MASKHTGGGGGSSLSAKRSPMHFETLPFMERTHPGDIERAYVEKSVMPAVRHSLTATLEDLPLRPMAEVIRHLRDLGEHSGRSEASITLPVSFHPSLLLTDDAESATEVANGGAPQRVEFSSPASVTTSHPASFRASNPRPGDEGGMPLDSLAGSMHRAPSHPAVGGGGAQQSSSPPPLQQQMLAQHLASLPVLPMRDELVFTGRTAATRPPPRHHLPQRFVKAGEHPVFACDVPSLSHLPGLIQHLMVDECVSSLHIVLCGVGDVQCYIHGKAYRATPTPAQWWSAVHEVMLKTPTAPTTAAAAQGGAPGVGGSLPESRGESPPSGQNPSPQKSGAAAAPPPIYQQLTPALAAELEQLLVARMRTALKQFSTSALDAASRVPATSAAPTRSIAAGASIAGASSINLAQFRSATTIATASTGASVGGGGNSSSNATAAEGGEKSSGGPTVSIVTPVNPEEVAMKNAIKIVPHPEYMSTQPKHVLSVVEALQHACEEAKGLDFKITRLQGPDDLLTSVPLYDNIFNLCEGFVAHSQEVALQKAINAAANSPSSVALTPLSVGGAPNFDSSGDCAILLLSVDRWQLVQHLHSVFALYFAVLRDVETLKRHAQLAESVAGRNNTEFAEDIGKRVIERRKKRDERRDQMIRAQLNYFVENRQDEPPDFMEKRGAMRNARNQRRRREDERRREVQTYQDSNAATKIQSMLRSLITRRRQRGGGAAGGSSGTAGQSAVFHKRRAALALDGDLLSRRYACGQFPLMDTIMSALRELYTSDHITTDRPKRNATKTVRNWEVKFRHIEPVDEWDVSSEEEEWAVERVDRVVTQFSASMNPFFLASKALDLVGLDDISLMRDLHENFRPFPNLQRRAATMLHRLAFNTLYATFLCFHHKRKILNAIDDPLPYVARTLRIPSKVQSVLTFEAFAAVSEPAMAAMVNMNWIMPFLSRVPIYTPLSSAPRSLPPGKPMLKGIGVSHVLVSGPRGKGALISEDRSPTAFQQLFKRVPIFLVPDMLTSDQWSDVAEAIVKRTACRRLMWLNLRGDPMVYVNGVPLLFAPRPENAAHDGSLIDKSAFRGVNALVRDVAGSNTGGGGAAGGSATHAGGGSGAISPAASSMAPQPVRPGAAGKTRGGGRATEAHDITVRSPTPSEADVRSNHSATSYSAYSRGSASDMHSAIVRHAANMGVHEYLGLQWEKVEGDLASEVMELIEDDESGKLTTHIQKGARDVDGVLSISDVDTDLCDRPAPLPKSQRQFFPSAAIMRGDGPLAHFGVDPSEIPLSHDEIMQRFAQALPTYELVKNAVPCVRPSKSSHKPLAGAHTTSGLQSVFGPVHQSSGALSSLSGGGQDESSNQQVTTTGTPQESDLKPGPGSVAGGGEKVAQGAARRGARAIARDRQATLGGRTQQSRATSSIGTEQLTDEEASLPLRATDVVRTAAQIGEEVRSKLRKATSLDNPLIFVRLPIASTFTLAWLRCIDVLYLLCREVFADSHVVLTLGVANPDTVFIGALAAVVYAVEFDKSGTLGVVAQQQQNDGHSNQPSHFRNRRSFSGAENGGNASFDADPAAWVDSPADGDDPFDKPSAPPPVSIYASVCRLVAAHPRLELQQSVVFVDKLLDQIGCRQALFHSIANHMAMAEACVAHGQPHIGKWHAIRATQRLERYILLVLFHNFVKFVQEKRQVMSMMNVDFSFREHLVSLPSVMRLLDNLDPWEGRDRSNPVGPAAHSPFSASAQAAWRWRKQCWVETIG